MEKIQVLSIGRDPVLLQKLSAFINENPQWESSATVDDETSIEVFHQRKFDIILFIEDWNENWYHVDRMMINLKRSGLLDRIKGLIVGSFTKMDVENENPQFNSDYDQKTYEVIQKIINEFEIPVAYQFPAGHIGDNRAIILGNEVSLEVNENYVILDFEH